MSDVIDKAIADVTTTILTFIVTVAVPYGLSLLRTWVKAKTSAIEDRALRDGIEWALARLDATAETVVREIEQVVKTRNADGRVVSPDTLLSTAMARTWKRIPPHAVAALKKMYPEQELQKVVRGKIESKIKPACK